MPPRRASPRFSATDPSTGQAGACLQVPLVADLVVAAQVLEDEGDRDRQHAAHDERQQRRVERARLDRVLRQRRPLKPVEAVAHERAGARQQVADVQLLVTDLARQIDCTRSARAGSCCAFLLNWSRRFSRVLGSDCWASGDGVIGLLHLVRDEHITDALPHVLREGGGEQLGGRGVGIPCCERHLEGVLDGVGVEPTREMLDTFLEPELRDDRLHDRARQSLVGIARGCARRELQVLDRGLLSRVHDQPGRRLVDLGLLIDDDVGQRCRAERADEDEREPAKRDEHLLTDVLQLILLLGSGAAGVGGSDSLPAGRPDPCGAQWRPRGAAGT